MTTLRLLQLGSRWVALAVAAVLAACASPPPTASDAEAGPSWQSVTLPGKRETQYVKAVKDGRKAVRAVAIGSSSLWRMPLDIAPEMLGDVAWSWWVDQPIAGSDIAVAELSDAPARVIFAFDGDHDRLTPRNRMLFDLSRALTGERPPYASLVYVWANETPVGSVVANARTDRIRKIVLDAGTTGARQWRDHRRNLVQDYINAFGEPPGRLIGVAMMTDADNTRSRAEAWYGPIELLPPTGAGVAPPKARANALR